MNQLQPLLPLERDLVAALHRSGGARARPSESRSALVPAIEYLLLIAVLSVLVAVFVLTLEQGVVDLAERVRHLLAPRH
jgi:hypothetical protein